jgi:hypothetical protein
MRKPYIPILILIILFNFPVNMDHFVELSTPILPGWHTTIYQSSIKESIFISTILLMICVLYWKLIKRNDKIPIGIFFAHFFCSLPTLVFFKIPIIYFLPILNIDNIVEFSERTQLFLAIQMLAYVLFSISQIFLMIYLLKNSIVESKIEKQDFL